MQRPGIVLFGDSLTQRSFGPGGWGAGVADAYCRKADILLRGYGGYNTRVALRIAGEVLPLNSPQPAELVTLWFGANDAALPDRLGARQHVPLEEYAKNLKALIHHIQQYGTQQLILLTPPPVNEAARVEHNKQKSGDVSEAQQPERTLEASGRYAEACKRVAKEAGLPVIDLWTQLQEKPNWQSLFVDGLHFQPEGQHAVFGLLTQAIKDNYPHLRPEVIKTDYPMMEELDFQNIDQCFDKWADAKDKPQTSMPGTSDSAAE